MTTSLFIATPCYGGNVNVNFMESVINLVMKCSLTNIRCEFFKIPFESLIPRGRNVCASAFLNSGCTHMIFIDADIMFDANDVMLLLKGNKDISGGSYPKKALSNNIIKTNTLKDTIAKCVNYTSIITKPLTTVDEKGFIESDYIATGFMMIKREVFFELIKTYPEIRYKNDINAYKKFTYNNYFYDFFQSKVINEKYVSEDYGFCKLWTNNGGKIYTNLYIKLNHIGNMIYYGNPLLKYSDNI